jgi:hypothetical protein
VTLVTITIGAIVTSLRQENYLEAVEDFIPRRSEAARRLFDRVLSLLSDSSITSSTIASPLGCERSSSRRWRLVRSLSFGFIRVLAQASAHGFTLAQVRTLLRSPERGKRLTVHEYVVEVRISSWQIEGVGAERAKLAFAKISGDRLEYEIDG